MKTFRYAFRAKASAKIPMPPINPKDPFLSTLASIAANSPEKLINRPVNADVPPYLDIFDSPQLMSSPAQVNYSPPFSDPDTMICMRFAFS